MISHPEAFVQALEKVVRESHATGRHNLCDPSSACKRARRIGGWTARIADPEGIPASAHGARAFVR